MNNLCKLHCIALLEGVLTSSKNLNIFPNIKFIFILVLFASIGTANAQSIRVSTTIDENNGNTANIAALIGTPGGTGISLREAILAANNEPNGSTVTITIPVGNYPITIVASDNTRLAGDFDALISAVAGLKKTGLINDAGSATTTVTGLDFSLSAAGVLSGKAKQNETYPITVKVSDNNGTMGTGATYNLVISSLVTPMMSSKLTDVLTVDNFAPGIANPGDEITYTNVIKNSGSNATNVTLTNPTPTNTTLVSGSQVTSALARDDNYTTFFNTLFNSGNVLTNDFGLPSVTVVSFGNTASLGTTTSAGSAGTTNAGGTLTVNTNGTLSYTPPPAFAGTDQFMYIATTSVVGLPNNDAVVTIIVNPDISFGTTLVNPPCNGGATGSITFTGVSGGSGAGYTYSITGAGGTYFASPVFNSLIAGTYNLAVKDGAGYIKIGTALLTQPSLITFSHADVSPTCNGNTNGSITFSGASGGSGAGYTYSITGSAGTYFASPSFTGLAAGTYNLAVKDGNGCIATGTATLTNPTAITFTFTKTDITCFGANNGSIVFNTASGGTVPYTYSITGAGGTFQISNSFTGLVPNAYSLVVKDNLGCNSAAVVSTVIEPAVIIVNGTIPNQVYNVAMATATFTKTGGTGSPANPWSATGLPTGVNINTANGQITGTPTVTGVFNAVVTYTDANGCTGTKNVSFNVAPALTNDTYAGVVGNTQLVANGHSTPTTPFTTNATNILGNDAPLSISVTAVTNAATTAGGTITIGTDGKFTYSPPNGVTGADSYTYTGTSNGVSATAVINFTIANMVWYVNNTYAGGNGAANGSSHRPYTDVASAETPSLINQTIYVHTGAGNTNGNALLKSGQTLRGAGNALNIGALSIAAGTKPTLTGMITLANSVNVDGFDMSTGATTAITSSGATSVTVSVGNISTSGAVNAITLTNTTGSITIAGGSLTGGAGATFNVSGGSATINCAAAINQATAAQRLINIQSITGGTITLSGNLSSTGTSTGINVASNTGGTINFSGTTKTISTGANAGVTLATNAGTTINFSGGGLAIATTAGTGFNAIGGATAINITGTANTISSGTGTALNVTSTTIGGSGLTFQSIASNGGSATGIILDNTGASGGLTITGDGSNTTQGGNGSGGTIANKTGADGATVTGNAIYLNNTANIILRRMQINNCQNLGIFGTSVTNFKLDYSTINGTIGDNSASNDACLAFGRINPGGTNGLLGTLNAITGCKFSGAIEHNLEFYNQSGSFTLNISGSEIRDNTTAFGSDGIQMEMQGTAVANITVQSCSFTNLKSQAFQAAANDNSNITLTADANTLVRGTQGNEGFIFSNGSNGILNATVTNNNISGYGGASIFTGQTPGNATSSSNLIVNISNNTVTTPTSATNSAIMVLLTSTVGQTANATILVNANNITQNSTTGVCRAILIDEPDVNTSPAFCATVTNNTAIVTDNVAGVVPIVCQKRRSGVGTFDVRGNVTTVPGVLGIAGLRVRQVAPGTCQLEQGASAGTPVVVLAANNPGATTEVLGTVTVVINSTCSPLLFAPGGVDKKSSVKNEVKQLKQSSLDTRVALAIELWTATGLTKAQLAVLHSLKFEMSDLPEMYIGLAGTDHIILGKNAGGNKNSWYIGTSNDDNLFNNSVSKTRTYTYDGSEAAGHVDLLTALMHEMGHKLGFEDSYDLKDRESIMYGYLTNGERRIPTANDIAALKTTKSYLFSNTETVFQNNAFPPPPPPVSIGDIPAGDSIVIVYKVTVNNPLVPVNTTQISSQGTVNGGNFSSFVTDDPDDNTSNVDPTITPADNTTCTLNTITLTSVAGTNAQTVCINTGITNITYSTTGATGATVTGLPTGVTGSWAANVVTISGTPSVSGTFNYTVTLTGGCGTVTATGTIAVTPNNTITLTSAAGTNAQTVCINTGITHITYATTGATGATFSGLPAGVTGNWAANVVTISGSPTTTVGSPFSYTVTLTGGCGIVTATATITVTPANTVILTSAAGTNNQTVVINTPITNITYGTTGATGATFTGLPAGVTGGWAANVVTISGSPTTISGSPFNYTVTLTGGCGSVTATGTITVVVAPPIVLTCPVNTTTTACQTQATVNTAFAAWLATASGTGGCSGVLTNNNTGAPSNCGGSTTVTFTYASSCLASTTTCQATFAVPAPPAVILTCPVNTTTTACQTQAAVNTAFAAWLATASSSGGCNGVLTNNNTGAPSACGGSTTVTFTNTSTCAPLTTTCQATFAVPAPPTVILTCPVNTTTTACQTQAAVNTAFAAWLATASSSGGCNGVLTNNNTGAPSACGGSTTVTFTNTSTCAPLTTTCQATFTVPAPPTVILTCPVNTTTTACQTQASVNTAFAAWLATASSSGGCNGVLTNNNTGAPSACGGSTTVTFTYTSTCAPLTTTCQATFTVPAPPTIAMTCPAPITVCADAIPAPNIASVTGVTGCGVVVTFVNDVPSSPLSDKSYTITRTYRAIDICSNSITCTQIITVKALSTAPTSISGTTNICNGSSTTLTVVGGSAGTGAIAEWFTGSCGGTSAGTGNSIIVAPTVFTTYFVRYKGDCNTTACASVSVSITAPSVGGTVSPAQSQGCGPQTVNLSVSGITGTVTNWERQTNCTGAWASIGNAGLTNITVTTPNSSTCYRAVVTNGVCPSANSSIATITVDKPAVGGKVTLQSNMTATSISLCPSENTVLLAKGFVGKVATWQYSFSTSPIWYDLPGTVGQTTLTVNGSSIVGTVFYRVVICSELGLCTGWSAVAYSSAFRITQKTGCLSPDGSLVNNYIATDQRLTIQKVYPNPANALITLEIEANTEGVAQVEIMDVIGRQVLNQTATLTEGMNSISLDISQLSKGVFIIKMTDNKNQKAWVKMVKE